MSWKIWVWLFPLVGIVVGVGIWLGWMFMSVENNSVTIEADSHPSATKESGEFSGEVVNTPVSDSVIVFKKDRDVLYENGHDFISKIHNFYNETLGWGRIDSASYSEQRDMAETIINAINSIGEIKDKDLQKDFLLIQELATTVRSKDDRDAMRKLHRYFHDLDIILNGYDYDDTFQITTFKGN